MPSSNSVCNKRGAPKLLRIAAALFLMAAVAKIQGTEAGNSTLNVIGYDSAGNITTIEYGSTILVVSSFFPSAGPVGEQVTIYGDGFSSDAAENIVTFNGARASVLQATRGSLLVQIPPGATTGPIRVDTKGQAGTSPSEFTIVAR